MAKIAVIMILSGRLKKLLKKREYTLKSVGSNINVKSEKSFSNCRKN